MRKGKKFAEGGVTDYNTTDYASSGSAGGTNISFGEAFRAARKQGLKNFSWKGKSYNTKTKEDAAPKKAESLEEVTVSSSRKKAETPAPKKAEPMQEVTVSASQPKLSELSRPSKPSVSSQTGGMKAALKAGEDEPYKPSSPSTRGGARRKPDSSTSKFATAREYANANRPKFPEAPATRARMSPMPNYKSGGSVKKYNSGGSVRGKGCEVKGTGRGRQV